MLYGASGTITTDMIVKYDGAARIPAARSAGRTPNQRRTTAHSPTTKASMSAACAQYTASLSGGGATRSNPANMSG